MFVRRTAATGRPSTGPRKFAFTFRAWALVLVCAPRLASAQSAASDTAAVAADTLRLSLPQCVERALSAGEEIQAARVDRAVAQARYLQARSTALPQLSLNATYTRQFESIFGDQGGGFGTFEPDTTAALDARVRALERELPNSGFYALGQIFSASSFASPNAWNVSLGVTQKLFQGGSIWASITAARHVLGAAELLEADRGAAVTLEVRAAYLDALLAARTERITELGLEEAENHLRRVQLRQEAGEASEFDLLQAEVQRDNQLPLVMAARQARQVTLLMLRQLCNLPALPAIRLTSAYMSDAALPAQPAAPDTVGLLADALHASGVSALELSATARQDAVTVAAAERWPELSLFANLSQQAYPADTFPSRGDWMRDKNAGVALSWSLFDGLFTKGAVREARANAARADYELARAREQVSRAVTEGLLELQRAAADLRARSRTVQLAKRALDLANLRYEEGASSLLEVSDARIAWQLAQSYEARARRDYFAALALLERVTGRPLFASATIPEVDP